MGVFIGGIATALIDGKPRDLGMTANVDIGGEIRTPQVGLSGNTGKYTSKIEPPEIEVELLDGPNESMMLIRAITNATVQLALKTGKTYLLHGAYQTGKLKLNVADGKYSATFSGVDCVEILAG